MKGPYSDKLFISFSGGETSAYMARRILTSDYIKQYKEHVVLFANTGQENEQTLDFVDKCDKAFGLNVIWVESVVHHELRKAPTAKIVNYQTASRNGEPFEEVIKKYGIPNSKFKNCTRDLKLNPMRDYLESIGWRIGEYDTAIGIRIDEIDRMSVSKEKNKIVYPLIEWLPTTKPDVNTFWKNQPFRLGLKGYQGNCKWCWKKSLRKHMTILQENPEVYDFPQRMEELYGHIGPEFKKGEIAGYKRTFFRANMSVKDLKAMCSTLGPEFVKAEDDSMTFSLFDPMLDVGAGCEESCEVFADEDGAEP